MDRIDFLKDYSGLSIKVVESGDVNDSLNVTSLDESGMKRPAEEGVSSEASKRIKLSADCCVRPKVDEAVKFSGASFWKDGWRKELCSCSKCLKLYESLKVEFLIDHQDPTQVYEEKGKGNQKQSNYMASLEALSTLPRVNQIDAISGYNHMKDKLFEFLQVLSLVQILSFQSNI